MSSRQEEKERRRQERIEREQAASSEAKRKRLVQIVVGLLVLAAIVVGVVLLAAGGGGDGGDGDTISEDQLTTAAKAANCTYRAFPNEGDDHVADELTPADFKTNPPTSGAHNPQPAQDGLYAAGNEPSLKNWVHTLEHGRIILMYRPGAPKATVDQLQKLLNEPVLDSPPAYHMVMMRNNTKMPFEAAAVAWRHYVGCPSLTPPALEAMRKFRDAFVDKGPEFVP
jgi:hypothetical protein